MANRRRDSAKEAYWREVLARQAASGLSVRAFCRQEQEPVRESAFYAWRRTLLRREGAAEPTFVPVVVADAPHGATSIIMELAGGRVLRIPATMPVERLCELVHALEARGAR
jgi:transposase